MLDGMFKIREVGNSEFPRMVIRDNRQPGRNRFWTGKGWTTNVGEALKYVHIDLAFSKILSLTRKYLFSKYSERKFIVPMEIIVNGPADITAEEIASYLWEALSVNMDYSTQGGGPRPESLVQVQVMLKEIQEATPGRSENQP